MSRYTEDLEMYRSNMDSCWDAGDTPDLLRVAEGMDKEIERLSTEGSKYKELAEAVGHMLFSFGYRSDMRPLYGHSSMTVNVVYTALRECGHDIDGTSNEQGELPLNWLSEAMRAALESTVSGRRDD